MNNFDLQSYDHMQLHVQDLMAEAERERLYAALTSGQPSVLQRAATSLGQALIRLGTWLAPAAPAIPAPDATSEA